VALERLRLGSPEGFSSPEMFKLGLGRVDLDVWSLLSDEIVIHEVLIDGAEFTLEFAGGKTNWGTLLQHLKQEPTEQERTARKTLRVGRVRFTHGAVQIAGVPLAGTLRFPLPEIEVTDLDTGEGKGTQARKVLEGVVASLYRAMRERAGELLPSERAEELLQEGRAVLGEVGGVLEQGRSAVDKALKGGLGGLLKPGDADKEDR